MAGKTRSRRGNGEGSICLAKGRDGKPDRWVARLTVDGRRRSFSGKTREVARRKLAAAIRDRDLGMPVVAEKQTVAAFFASWLEIVKPTIGPRTWNRYEQQVRMHVVPTLGNHKLARLTAQHIQRLYAQKLQEGLAPGTVHHLHIVVNGALKTALRLGLVQRNVADLTTPPQPDEKEMHALTPEQVQQLLAAAKGNRLEALYITAISTGARLGELLGLRWLDVDLEAGILHVRHTLSHTKGGVWQLGTPKTKASRRRIELAPSTVEALRKHRARQAEERLAMGEAWQDHGFVFCRKDGTPLHGTSVYLRAFRPLLKRAGLPSIRFHDLRHTAATLLLTQGIFVKQVSEMLGHSNVGITMTVYAHVLPTMHRDAAVVIERIMTAQ